VFDAPQRITQCAVAIIQFAAFFQRKFAFLVQVRLQIIRMQFPAKLQKVLLQQG